MSQHTCDAVVVCCIDFRFQKYIRNWTDAHLSDKTFDLVGLAGSTKNLDIIMEQISISVKLHEVKEVILIHHEECGAYGAESTPERHSIDLLKAKSVINEKFPDVKVHPLYLRLNGTFEPIL